MADFEAIESGMRKYYPDIQTAAADRSFQKNILVYMHSFLPGGSQSAMLELVSVLKSLGFLPWVIGMQDGEYKARFLSLQVPCGATDDVRNTAEKRLFLLASFDAVLINTIVSFPAVFPFINTDMPVIWWIHETGVVMQNFLDMFPLPSGLSDNIRFAGAAKLAQEGIKDVYCKDSLLLPLVVKDVRDCDESETDVPLLWRHTDRVRFLIPSAYQEIKGQDVLLQAVSLLPPSYAARSEFLLCGAKYDNSLEYYDLLRRYAAVFANVTMVDTVPREQIYRHFRTCDCVIAPSRVDMTPLTIIEAMMFEKLVLVSDAAGISRYITDFTDGFLFPSTQAEELYKRLLLIIEDHQRLAHVAAAGRMVYERNFSPEAAYKAWANALQ